MGVLGRERQSGAGPAAVRPARPPEWVRPHPLHVLQSLVGNRGVGELIAEPPPPVQRMVRRPVTTVAPPTAGPGKGSKDEEDDERSSSDSDSTPESESESETEEERKRRKKKERKRLKKEKKRKKKKKRSRAPTPPPVNPVWERNKQDLAYEITGSSRSVIYLQPPVRRHSITEVIADDIRGHNQFTTVTADTVATMAAYRDRILQGDVTRITRRGRTIEIDIDGRTFGCHDDTETSHDFLFPVASPTSSGLSRTQLECLIDLRQAGAETPYITRVYSASVIAAAKAALARAGIVIP